MNTITITNEGAALTWATKTGKSQCAIGAVAQAQAPRAARMGAAHEAALAQLANNQYRPVLRDVVQSLSPAALKGLQAHVLAGLSTHVDGVLMTPAGDILVANKRVMKLVGAWGAAPTTTMSIKGMKGVTETVTPKLTKAAMERLAPLLEWAAALSAGEALSASLSEAGLAPALETA